MKLGRAANLSPRSRVKTIFLPSSAHLQIYPNDPPTTTTTPNRDDDLFDRDGNYLRKLEPNVNNLVNLIGQANQNEIKRRQGGNRTQLRSADDSRSSTKSPKKKHRRRNDKFLHRRPTTSDDYLMFNRDKFGPPTSIDYFDCVAVGWGKYRNSGDLSDVLLKIEVPIQNIKRYFVIDATRFDLKTFLSGNSPTFQILHTISTFLVSQVRRSLLWFCFASSESTFVRWKYGRPGWNVSSSRERKCRPK